MKRLSTIIRTALFVVAACLPLTAQQQPVAPAAPKPSPQAAPQAPVKMPPVKALADSSAPKGWKKFQFGGEPVLFAIILPEKHDAAGEHIPMAGADKPATTYVYTGETESSVYMAMCVENLPFVGERMPEEIKQAFYDGMWKGMLEGMKSEMNRTGLLFKVVPGEMKKITVSGLDGRSQDFTFGPLNGHARMVMAGQRAYLALIMAPPDGGEEREAFFNSFEIYAKR
jgi:hypothetical protein